MKKVAILQSNYIPWKGYFDKTDTVDEFILYGNMQYTRRDCRNCNQIKTPQGLQCLTVPVGQGINRRIRDVTVGALNFRNQAVSLRIELPLSLVLHLHSNRPAPN